MSHSGRHNAPNSAPKRPVWQCNMAHPAMQYGTQDRENKPVQQCHLRKFRPCHATNVTTGKRASAENPWKTKPPNDFQGISVCLDFKKNKATAEASLTSTENKKAAPPNCHATPHRHQPPPVHTAMATRNGSARHTTASERKTHRIFFSIKPFIPTNVILMTTVTTND